MTQVYGFLVVVGENLTAEDLLRIRERINNNVGVLLVEKVTVQPEALLEQIKEKPATMPNIRKEAQLLLHTLWTKAVGTPGYDKEQWKRLERFIDNTQNMLHAAKVEVALGPAREDQADDS